METPSFHDVLPPSPGIRNKHLPAVYTRVLIPFGLKRQMFLNGRLRPAPLSLKPIRSALHPLELLNDQNESKTLDAFIKDVYAKSLHALTEPASVIL